MLFSKLPNIKPIGDSTLQIAMDSTINLELNQKIHQLDSTLIQKNIPGIISSLPTYCTLMISYDPLLISFSELEKKVLSIIQEAPEEAQINSELIEIPTKYGGVYGPDLEHVADHNEITPEKVIQIHSSRDYPVYMMGFTPGFPYLGGMDSRIATPRLKSPRTLVPAGSVGIAGEQTGIYPLDSPGGWQLIGRTSTNLFDPQSRQPFLLKPGSMIRFIPVDEMGGGQ
ncbi:MAG: 5-oxoprolinase subunit PxpB [Anaerolineaceae bacterium]|nr:5-oxoprolinase subunit PxpB [Anaerolineaceae bacterium]